MISVAGHAAKFFITAIDTRPGFGESEARLAVLALLARELICKTKWT